MPGTIIFKPIEANLTHDADLIGKADPYCMFVMGGQKVKGQVCKSGGKHPVWNESVTLPISNQATCLVELKDKDFLKDDKLGSFEIDIREVESQGMIKKWYPIFYKERPAGEVLMEAYFSADGQSQGLNPGYSQNMQANIQSFNQTMPTSGLQHGNPKNGMTVPLTTFHTITPSTVLYPGFDNPNRYAEDSLMRGVDPLGSQKIIPNQTTVYPNQLGGNQNFINNTQPYPNQLGGNQNFINNAQHLPTQNFTGTNQTYTGQGNIPLGNMAQPNSTITASNIGNAGVHQHHQNIPGQQQMVFGHGHNQQGNIPKFG